MNTDVRKVCSYPAFEKPAFCVRKRISAVDVRTHSAAAGPRSIAEDGLRWPRRLVTTGCAYGTRGGLACAPVGRRENACRQRIRLEL
jgi:hypothetical protein